MGLDWFIHVIVDIAGCGWEAVFDKAGLPAT
jgi:hypothetical protein